MQLRLIIVLSLALLFAACEVVDAVDENQAVTGRSLCLSDYQMCIDPIFHANLLGSSGIINCSSSGCHDTGAGSGGGFKLHPTPALNSEQMRSNFYTAQAFANFTAAADSKLLLEPLTGTFSITGSHAGGDIFIDQNDPCYIAIIDWVSKQVADENSAACGACTPPVLSACGY